MNDRVRFRPCSRLVCLFFLSGLAFFSRPPILLAEPPNVVIHQGIHFSTINGNPVTLSPGTYLVEQAGPQELRLTAVADKQEFHIQAEALNHEQYELFSPMALTRYSKNHEFLINLFLPGGVKLEAKGSSKEIPKSIPGQGQPPIPPVIESSVPPSDPTPSGEAPQKTTTTPDPKPLTLPLTTPIPDPVSSATTIIEDLPGITYRAPSPDQPGLRIDGESLDMQFPSVFVLAPNHVGHTSQEYPILYWYLSHSTQNPLDVMIAEEGNLEVLLNIRLLPPLQAGIHELRLVNYDFRLLPDVPYRWTVRINNPQASDNPTASGAIRRIHSSTSSSDTLIYSPEEYAQKGQWYDALTALTQLIHSNHGNRVLLAQRASLLEQVGLTKAAAFVRQAKTP